MVGGINTDVQEINQIVVNESTQRDCEAHEKLLRQKQYWEAAQLKRHILDTAHTALRVGMFGIKVRALHESKVVEVDPWQVILNTALIYGSDPVKLAAYLHGQCEIHLWIAGRDRKWAAGIIREGLKTGIYRENLGWDKVIALLEKSNRGVVVTDFSVCDSWNWKNKPNRDTQLDHDRLCRNLFDGGLTVHHLHDYARKQGKNEAAVINAADG